MSAPKPSLARRIGGFLVALAIPAALIGVIGFFTFQVYTGDYGRIALEKAERQLAAAEHRFARLEAREQTLIARNRGLRPEGLDLDLLDERARDVLGMIGRDEVFLIRE